jgi:hypothetical protein
MMVNESDVLRTLDGGTEDQIRAATRFRRGLRQS